MNTIYTELHCSAHAKLALMSLSGTAFVLLYFALFSIRDNFHFSITDEETRKQKHLARAAQNIDISANITEITVTCK